MNWIDFFQWIPNLAIAFLVLIIALAVWFIWRAIAPAGPGISLGFYEVVGRYADQKLIKRLKGTFVDATPHFVNQQVETGFFRFLKEDIDTVINKTVQPSEELKALSEFLENETPRLSDYVKVIVTREKIFTKHALIQYKYVDKPLNAYAAHDPQAKFSLGFGFLTQGVITGEIHTLPTRYEIPRLGKFHVHLFKPDAPPNEPARDPPEYLAKLSLYAPAYVELTQQLKAKDEILKESKRERQKADKQLAAHSTLVDSLLTAIQGFTTKYKPGEAIAGRGFDLMDFVTIAFPTLLGYVIAESMGIVPIVGVFFGLFLGAFLVFRRAG